MQYIHSFVFVHQFVQVLFMYVFIYVLRMFSLDRGKIPIPRGNRTQDRQYPMRQLQNQFDIANTEKEIVVFKVSFLHD